MHWSGAGNVSPTWVEAEAGGAPLATAASVAASATAAIRRGDDASGVLRMELKA
jgi:hypothetical protein